MGPQQRVCVCCGAAGGMGGRSGPPLVVLLVGLAFLPLGLAIPSQHLAPQWKGLWSKLAQVSDGEAPRTQEVTLTIPNFVEGPPETAPVVNLGMGLNELKRVT